MRSRVPTPCLAAILAVALCLGGLLVGHEPVGGDPDLMYRPIKSALARTLRQGRLPFWSDSFGLGVPLVAESHVAAFYPMNWLAYRALEVPAAYRLLMWLHYVLTAVTTYAYARVLAISPWGSALAAVAFALCGFQAAHACHEPFYHVMPYLPLCLLLADRYATTGRRAWLAGLALAWGAQLTLGHFQIQMWTGGLVMLTGGWRVISGGRPWWRSLGLVSALGWGSAVAAAQLGPTWELTRVAGFDRPAQFLTNYSFPPAHWAQAALPGLFLVRDAIEGDSYWGRQVTTFGEACFYVGITPLILAFLGVVAAPRDRGLTPWRLIAPAGFALATMPRWWPDGFWALAQLPGLGWFRAPARYTLLTSLGLALLAGRGLDRGIVRWRSWAGLALAVLFGASAFAWSVWWSRGADFRASLGAETLPWRFALAALAWIVGLGAVVAWRWGRLPPWGPFLVASVELIALFHCGPTRWGRAVDFPAESPIARRLAQEPGVGLVGGRLEDLPARLGLAPAFPYLGIVPPPPNYLLEPAKVPPGLSTETNRRWQRRFGVTHGVWEAEDDTRGTETIAEGPDEALDRLLHGPTRQRPPRRWRLVRNPAVFPPAWTARLAVEAPSWGALYSHLSDLDAEDEAWFLADDHPADGPEPRARSARVRSWDGRTAVVDHDGTCDLIMRRTFYPGWSARVDGGPERPVLRVNGGFQGVRLDGAGTSRVVVRYRPTGLRRAAVVSVVATLTAVVCLLLTAIRSRPVQPQVTG